MVALLYPAELDVHLLQSLTDPRMGVPVFRLLALDLRKETQPLHHFVVLEVLDVLEAQQDLVGGQSVPVDAGRVVDEEVLVVFRVEAMSDQEGDGDGEGYCIFGLQVGRTHVELPIEPIQSVIVCLYALLEGTDFPGSPILEGKKGGEFP